MAADGGKEARTAYEKQALAAAMAATGRGRVRLGKDTTNLFRERVETAGPKLDVRAFDTVVDVDPAAQVVDIEAMVTYDTLVRATLARRLLPAVVPELKSITIGGAISGLGIEAWSFKYGLAHETIEEMEVLLADGDVVVCTPNNNYKDLFFGLPNSFGTLGYVLRVRAKLLPVQDYVHVTRRHHSNPDEFFRDLEACCNQDVDFVEGVVFAPNEMYLSIARFVPDAPYTSDYTYMNIYYRPSGTERMIIYPRQASSGAGIPIGSGAHATWRSRTRSSGGSSAGADSIRSPIRRSSIEQTAGAC